MNQECWVARQYPDARYEIRRAMFVPPACGIAACGCETRGFAVIG
jgi:hypothetical protein